MADEGFQNEVVPLKKPDAADYPGAYDPKANIEPDIEKPGAIPLPLPGAGTPKLSSTDDIKNAIRGLTHEQKNGSVEDPWVRAKTQKFDAGMHGLQFERYYNHPSFKQLGFSPFRDNETLYNQESNAIQDAARAWTQFGKVSGLGFTDAMGFGSLTDIGTAKEYEKAMAIGSSSRGGAAGFTTNLFMNSAYTVGIIGETMLEELGLALITGASGLAASEATIPLMISRGLRASNKIQKSYSVGKNILRTLDNLKDVNKARKYFKDAVKGTADFLSPIDESVKFMQGLSKADELKNLSDMAKTAHGFAAFYKDVRNVRLAWGESGLEGGMVRNEVSEDLLNAHVEKFGRAPTKEEADRISDIALQAGMSTGWQNIFAIYYSNKIVFENLFKGFKPLAKFADDAAMDFGKAGKVLQKKTELSPYVRAKKNWKTMVEAAKDPLTYGKTALGYFKANVAEGLQETVQEVIGGAERDAAMDEWKGTALKGSYLAAVGDNLQKQMTPEGLEVFMSGFLMGGMVQPITRIPGILTENFHKFKDPAKYKEQRAKQETYVNELVNKLNDLHNNAYSQLEPNLDHLARQDEIKKGMDEAGAKGDGRAFYDLKDQGNFENVMMALKHNRIDSLLDRLEDLKGLTPEEIKEGYGIEQEQFLRTIDKTIANTKRIEQRYKAGRENMENPVDPGMYQKGTAEHTQAVIDAMGWDNAFEKFLFLQESFDRNLERKTSILDDVQQDTKLANVPTSKFAPLYSIEDSKTELDLLNAEIAGLKGATGDIKKQRDQLVRQRDLLKNFSDKMVAVEEAPVAEEGKPLTAADKKYIRSVMGKAKTAYKKYVKNLAKDSKDHVFDDALDKSFQKLVDYYSLDAETLGLNDAVNKMLDPNVYAQQAERGKMLHKLREEQKQTELRDSLDKYVESLNTQRLMELLYDNKDRQGNARKRMFFEPDELKALLEEGKVPTTFYYGDQDTGEKITEVPRNSKDFREALDIIGEFVPNMMNIPISEEDMRDARNVYSSKARPKKKNDKRTYADLAKQFGFDPKADETKVPLGDVLDAIIKSKYATKDEQILAKLLKEKVSEGEVVTFTNKGTSPGSYEVAAQTVIDARYNASNYRNGGLPIEHVILHEEIHRRTVEELELDPEFRTKIEALYETTLEHFKNNVPLIEGQIPYGLASVQEFMAEAMSNHRFQEELAKIEFETTGTPVWNKFVDAVLAMLKKTFGRTISNSVLNEAMYLITTKIDSRFTTRESADQTPIPEAGQGEAAPAVAEELARTLETTKITPAINPVDLATAPYKPLADALVQEYRKVNAELVERAQIPLDSEYENKTDDEIVESSQFKRFYRDPRRASVKKIFDKFNADTGRVFEPRIEPTSPTTKGEAITNALKAEGYTTAEIGAMTVATAVQYANDLYKTKAEREAAVARDIAGEEEVRARLKAKVRQTFEEKIEEAKSSDELEVNYDDALNFMRTQRATPNSPTDWAVSEYTAEEIEAIYNDKLRRLQEEFAYDDVVVNSVIQLKAGNVKMYVTEKTNNKITGHKLGDPTAALSVTKTQFKNKVKYVVTAANINTSFEGLPEEFTPEDHGFSAATDENINNTDVDANIDNDNPEGPNPCG